MLAPVTEVHYGEEELLRLNIASSELYPSFVDELEGATGLSCGYEPSGTLIVARDADDDRELDDIFEFQRSLGLKVERLRGDACRELEPGLTSRARGGILAPDDHRIDPAALVRALHKACAAAGVEFVPERVQRVERGRVVTENGRHDADAIVVAAGAHSSRIEIPKEVTIPIRPVKGQLVMLRGAAPATRHNIRGLDAYLVSRSDGRVVLGATMEERGFETTVTGEGVFELLRAAYEFVPGILELEFEGAVSGLRPASPDNAPLIGRSEIDGIFLATGHFRNGVLLAPVTGEALAKLVTGGSDERVAPFSPQRFAAR